MRPGRWLGLVALLPACRDTGGWSYDVDAEVQALIDAPRVGGARPLAVFDFDNTMLDGDIAFCSIWYQAAKRRWGFDPGAEADGPFSPELSRMFRRYEAARGSPAELRLFDGLVYALYDRYRTLKEREGKPAALAYVTRLLSGLTPDEARALSDEALRACQELPACLRTFSPTPGQRGRPMVEQWGVRLRPAIAWMLRRLKRANFEIHVVSASPEWLVEAAAARYGLSASRVHGVRTRVEGGRIGREIVPPITWRAGKVDAIRREAGRRPDLAFGDAWTDFEMLTWARTGVLVDRDERDLKEALEDRGVLVQPRFAGERAWRACPE